MIIIHMIALIVFLIGCTQSDEDNEIVNIAIDDNPFQPAIIKEGTTVIWTDMGDTEHTVTSDLGNQRSGSLLPGNSGAILLMKKGNIIAHCIP